MNINLHEHDQAGVLELRGSLDREACRELRELTEARLRDHMRDVVIDLRQTEFIDSEGFETLLWLVEACEERLGQLRVANCPPHIDLCLRLTRLEDRFPRHDSVQDALAGLR